ncbi:TRAP-type C4-dicarboxylate transport system permease small subunit [Nocardioides cavernae]|uniref:TRAP-type C4-dicarboxylate transport system permease small subunit n=1 Tax=Nocardioides cavernae TaxID=1921566 RepID=A0A7Y9H148_9ACTN|nr:TRAP transporter small permease [Nocardioides cavernae]NYE35838.1 TRAP-type C4-dicarboxylate transport system permease small subunit [Nocardioides cavernae]
MLASTIHALSRGLAVFSIAGMVFVMLIVVWNVTLRELGQPGVKGIVEYSELGMAVTAFFALGEAERRRQHVSVDAILGRLKGRTYQVLRIAGGVAAAFIAVLLAWASWNVLSDSLATGEYKLGLVRLPMWPARLAVFAGFLVLALEQIVTAVEDAIERPVDPVLEGHAL